MTTEPGAGAPQYIRIAHDIRRLIEDGAYAPGDRLPSTRSMADEFGVSAMTISSALQELHVSGVVDLQGRRGAIVQTPGKWRASQTAGGDVRPSIAELANEVRSLKSEVEDLRSRLDRIEKAPK